jgi:hypothetical protein
MSRFFSENIITACLFVFTGEAGQAALVAAGASAQSLSAGRGCLALRGVWF